MRKNRQSAIREWIHSSMFNRDTVGHTLYGSPNGFSQDRGADISPPLFLWLHSLIYSDGLSGVETKACVPSILPAVIWGFLLFAGAVASWR